VSATPAAATTACAATQLSFASRNGPKRRVRARHPAGGLYWERGFADARFGPLAVVRDPKRRVFNLTIPIAEGPRYRIGAIDVAPPGDPAQVGVSRGDLFARTPIQRTCTELGARTGIEFEVTVTIDRPARTIALDFHPRKTPLSERWFRTHKP
jgi:hypothetical protein